MNTKPKKSQPPKPTEESTVVNLGETKPIPVRKVQPPKPKQPSTSVTRTAKPRK